MSAPRFYIPHLAQATTGFLDGPEARHATSVLRLGVDDCVVLFDGLGGEVLARIVAVARARLEYEIVQRIDCNRELKWRLTLAIALPKGDRQRTLIDAATELGVTDLIPLRTQRGVAQPTDSALERLERNVIEACKQCGRNRLMLIHQPCSLQELLLVQPERPDPARLAEHQPLRLIAHPYDEAGIRLPLSRHFAGPQRGVTIAIGPEGGFTATEVKDLLANGWQAVDLGPTILRIEIAAISAVAQIAAWLQQTTS